MTSSFINSIVKRLAVLGLACLAAAPAMASLSPATWVSHRLIGVKGDSWVAMRAERHFSSYYKYRTKSELHLVQIATGCRSEAVVLKETETVDENASGNWSVKAVGGGPLPAAALDNMVPVMPRGWHAGIKIVSGAVTVASDEKDVVVIPAGMVAKWAELQGIPAIDELQISGMFESTDAVRQDGMMFLELETRDGGDIDVDYARFIVPLAIVKLFKELESGVTNLAKLAGVQPQPIGC